jgi:uncharacterized protein YjiK
MLSCSDKTINPDDPQLVMVNSYTIDVSQPSGLTFGKDFKTLWTVSDTPNGGIYELNLEGDIIRTLEFESDDLEGITYDHTNDILWTVDEQNNEIIKISTDNQELQRAAIPMLASQDHGVEGITLESDNKFWIANEKLPKKLFLMNSNFVIEEEYEPDLAEDYSGLCLDTDNCILWIVSDESQLIIKWSPCKGTTEKYSIPITKAEGIAINHQDGQIFIVSDAEQKLFEFRIE